MINLEFSGKVTINGKTSHNNITRLGLIRIMRSLESGAVCRITHMALLNKQVKEPSSDSDPDATYMQLTNLKDAIDFEKVKPVNTTMSEEGDITFSPKEAFAADDVPYVGIVLVINGDTTQTGTQKVGDVVKPLRYKPNGAEGVFAIYYIDDIAGQPVTDVSWTIHLSATVNNS